MSARGDQAARSWERALMTDPQAAARALGAIARRLGHEAGIALIDEMEREAARAERVA